MANRISNSHLYWPKTDELARLVWNDLHLEGEHCYVVVRNATAKNAKESYLPLHPESAEELGYLRPANAQVDKVVFKDGISCTRRLSKDLEMVDIEYKDALVGLLSFMLCTMLLPRL
ncbi:hypothetical protein [Rubellicoccus peritrichatus]|uniref:Uncharacterized protein n=1 Tax=Rubellicoccus peritrichatus TaxID=3080537 RepID=A0AAQ3LDJ1_9BACT|nr:hypothetical protein [Puniceicoccus sp. CR14]WOO40099.1 hypothetical protein RZN69_15870 [Puniceicoccus sp. CR14]